MTIYFMTKKFVKLRKKYNWSLYVSKIDVSYIIKF